MKEFNWKIAPLNGKNLIEASAGTGKTFTISRIYLRLILERKLTVQEILVVTFTEAATNELKERIHKTLLAARDALNGQNADEELCKYIKAQMSDNTRERLTIALQDFDEAAVFTIHKFCNRVLMENAFESGGVFDTELVTEQTGLLNEAVEDFWRQKIYSQSGMFLSYALSKISPEKFVKLVQRTLGRSGFKILPEDIPEETDTSSLEKTFTDSYFLLKQSWQVCKDEIRDLLLNHGGLNGQVLKREVLVELLENMELYTQNASANPALFKNFDRLTQSYLITKTNRTSPKPPPKHSFFETCESYFEEHRRLSDVFDHRLILLKKELFEFVRTELRRKKEERNVFFFDDLLLNLHAVLSGENPTLANSVRAKFNAALVDEFQDTDPIQYEIFSRIFDHQSATLFLIGDPKQAIYGFRGADVFAYMQAKKNIQEGAGFTLTKNYRSESDLVQAFNHIFQATDNAFIYEEIPFDNAVAGETPDKTTLKIQGETKAPMQLWFYDPDELSDPLQKRQKNTEKNFITDRVADEIARLLSLGRIGAATIEDAPLAEKDIAVLVRTNAESRMVQEALRKRNVHSVLYTTDNLFASHEALELERVLLAISSPKSLSRLKAALATEMFGLDAGAILQFDKDDAALENWLNKFAGYYHDWQEFGFVRMMNDLLKNEEVLQRLITFEDGERRITNLLHLAEMLNENSVKYQLGINGLIKWLAEQRKLIDKSVEEHQIRLESDENAVKLITMHMSKGLQYPVVFCPFAWGASTVFKNVETLEFHDENNERNFTVDLDSHGPGWPQHKMMAEKELLAENLRLLYVALTRARNRCYLVWGKLPSARTSAMAYLLHKPMPFDYNQPVDILNNHLNRTKTDVYLNRSEELAAQSQGSIGLQKIMPAKEIQLFAKSELLDTLQARKFTVTVDTKQRISSYSGLVSKHPHSAELADYDAIEIGAATEPAEVYPEQEFSNFMSFPRGSKAGTFLHDLLENLDFAKYEGEATTAFVFEKLRQYGFDTEWQRAILSLIERVMKVKLKGISGEFSLSEIKAQHCIKELEFYFPVEMLSPKKLLNIFSNHGHNSEFVEKLRHLHFAEFKGFMKGFIDLIFKKDGRFYIVDWKSNFLGSVFKNYDLPSLTREMYERLYVLQYQLYTLALNNYLSLRLPNYDYNTDFGGVFYIFLRCIEPEKAPDCGVYFDRPEAGFMQEFSKTIVG